MCTARPAAARALDMAALMAAIEAVGFSRWRAWWDSRSVRGMVQKYVAGFFAGIWA